MNLKPVSYTHLDVYKRQVGMWWTEYYGERPTGGWLAIKISGVDIDPGTEGDTVLNSITFG